MKNKLKNLLNTILFSVLVLLITSCVQSSNYYPSIGNDSNKQPPYLFNEPKIITEDVPEIPTNKKDVDVLVMMYMDGDNGLHNDIWSDLVETVSGYSKLSDGYNVEVVILWDGCVNFRMNRKWQSNSWNYVSKLFRVGKDYSLIDISNNISWLHNNPDDPNETEVSMNDIATLTNFLNWANRNYKSDMKILQLSDHGTGPADLTRFRAICEDQGTVNNKSIDEFLGTKDVPQAIRNSGIGIFDLVIQDVCLGSTIEEVYEYKDVADYMLLSPNLTPGEGHNYINVIKQLSNSSNYYNGTLNIEKYITNIMEGFINSYKNFPSSWNSFKTKWLKEKKLESISDYDLSLAPNTINPIDDKYFPSNINYYNLNYSLLSTLTGINVKKIESLKVAIDEMIDLIDNNPDRKVAAKLTVTGIPIMISYYKAVGKILADLDGYAATTGHIYDIGFLIDKIQLIANVNEWNELVTACDKIKSCLNDLIFASWRDGVGGALYYKSSIGNPNIKPILSSGTYGIAIAGNDFINNLVYPNSFDNDYRNSLAYARESKWLPFMDNIREGK